MRKLFVLLCLTGCAPILTELPFEEYLAPDGTRTWMIEIDNETSDFHAPKTHHQLIAEQMAWSRFCEAGYRIDRTESTADGRVYHGRCR